MGLGPTAAGRETRTASPARRSRALAAAALALSAVAAPGRPAPS